MNEKFLNVKGVSRYIHLSPSLIYKMVSTDRIPYIKIGTRTIFVREQIDQWVINGGKMGEELPALPQL